MLRRLRRELASPVLMLTDGCDSIDRRDRRCGVREGRRRHRGGQNGNQEGHYNPEKMVSRDFVPATSLSKWRNNTNGLVISQLVNSKLPL